MFCTKCGKKIDKGSVFCEFCGTKQAEGESVKEAEVLNSDKKEDSKDESLPSVSKEIMNKELKKIADHLEFLGYEIENLDMENKNVEFVAARHINSNNYVFHEIAPEFVFFQTGLKTELKQDPAMDTAVNSINKALSLSRFYYEIMDGLVLLRIEAVYVGVYGKEIFARFRDLFEKEQVIISQHEDFRVFLKK